MQSPEAQSLRNTTLFIWDEAPTMHKFCFEAVDRLLRDVMQIDIPFGGKIFIIGGDFRQTLPVVLRGFRADIINATIKSSYLWRYVKQYRLIQNMRLNPESQHYSQFLLQIGDGTYPTQTIDGVPDYVIIPDNIWIPLSINNLFNIIYDDFINQYCNVDYINLRSILAPLNTYTDDINNYASDLLPTNYKIYLSHDSVSDNTDNNNLFFTVEYLNSLDFSGIPPHELKLKENQPVILLRNISNHKGLCNGTRMIIKSKIINFINKDFKFLNFLGMFDYIVELEFIHGPKKGQRQLIPRMKLNPSDNSLPFEFIRKQFPIKPAYAITINKSQGQTLNKVGLYLPDSCFAHGQFYVGMGRVQDATKIFVSSPTNLTRNIVYREILNN
jgi:ATP-dependent DNA helicase PIF1